MDFMKIGHRDAPIMASGTFSRAACVFCAQAEGPKGGECRNYKKEGLRFRCGSHVHLKICGRQVEKAVAVGAALDRKRSRIDAGGRPPLR